MDEVNTIFGETETFIAPAVFIARYKCPAGHWCEPGTTSRTQNACPPGTYNPKEGAKTKSECIPAPPGYFIANSGSDALDENDKCNAGYFCKLGSYSATPDPTDNSDGDWDPTTVND